MKVFISHKKEDMFQAKKISSFLNYLGVENYLDELDHYIYSSNEELTYHIIEEMSECTDLLVVLSTKTQSSWWVPFEIGVASDRNYPAVTYLTDSVKIPEFLTFWPVITQLKELEHLKNSILFRERKISRYQSEQAIRLLEGREDFSEKPNFTEQFYTNLKRALSR